MAMSSAWTNSTAPGPDADESSMANMFVLVAAMSGLVYTAAVDKSEGDVPAFLTVDNLLRREFEVASMWLSGKAVPATLAMKQGHTVATPIWNGEPIMFGTSVTPLTCPLVLVPAPHTRPLPRPGMRLYFYVAAIILVAPSLYLISYFSGFALAVAAITGALAVKSGLSIIRADFELAKARPSREIDVFARTLNTGQKFFLVVIIPAWFASSAGGLASATTCPNLLLTMAAWLLVAFFKVGICMSTLLHRYAAHAAFKVGPVTNLVLGVLSCLAYQGGPLWWASKHRAHHKFCDTTSRDPHSPKLVGIANAFLFFLAGDSPDSTRSMLGVDEEFVPRHMDTPAMRVIDSLNFVFPLIEFYVATRLFGPPGLLVAWTSSWICCISTLWFNIRNHPDGEAEVKKLRPEPEHLKFRRMSDRSKDCDSTDEAVGIGGALLFVFLDVTSSIFIPIIGEGTHDHHHSHPELAQRPGLDFPQYFVYGLEMLGLARSVRTLDKLSASSDSFRSSSSSQRSSSSERPSMSDTKASSKSD